MTDTITKALEDFAQNPHTSFAILDLDVTLFAKCSTATAKDKTEALEALLGVFMNEEEDENKRHLAGILISDVLAVAWERLGDKSAILNEKIINKLEGSAFSSVKLRSSQARIIALGLEHKILSDIHSAPNALEDIFNDNFEPVASKFQEGDADQIDLAIRVVRTFIQDFDDIEGGKHARQLHYLLPIMLPALLEAFTCEEAGVRGRERILSLFYNLIRLITWADGIDNELVDKCLQDDFHQWMALFLQIIQSSPKQNFNVKKNALKCLTVIFRDLINFSKDNINMILKPAWKLLNSHMPIFTEVLAYNNPIPLAEGEELDEEEDQDHDDSSLGEDGEMSGIEGMTFALLELLSTLVLRPNVQSLVTQGLLPLLTSVSSYLLLQRRHERIYRGDPTFFIADNSQDLLKIETIRSQCLVLISSLIEVFGDVATQGVLIIIDKLFQKSDIKQQIQIEEETKSAVKQDNENSDEEEGERKINDQQREAQEFQALLQELAYKSNHPNNEWKRREVAILLSCVFMEDISMFMIRNPKYDAQNIIFNRLIDRAFEQAPKGLQMLLVGRSLQCALSSSELIRMHEDRGKEYALQMLKFAAEFVCGCEVMSVQLVALKTLLKFTRKVKPDEAAEFQDVLGVVVPAVIRLIERTSLETLFLPIEALALLSKISPSAITAVSPQITPKLLQLFRNHHNESSLGPELVNLFKQWTNNEECRLIMVQSFIPFIMQIVQQYYNNTPNAENKSALTLNQIQSLELTGDREPVQDVAENVVDAGILAHVLDLLCTLLKKAKSEEERSKIIAVFPELVNFIEKSDDMFLLLNGTTALKTFIHLAHTQILELVPPTKIVSLCKRLLQPSCNEQAAVCLGNLVIQVIHKIQPKVDTQLLLCVVWKIYKSRMPSTVQSLILIIARLVQTNPNEILTFLSQETIDNRISLKIVLDKWLLQQPLFRGPYTRTVTISSLLKMFQARDPRVETLMVIGYNPSHSNINSEVNAPFKMLSLLLRFLENESKPTKLRPLRKPVEDYDDDEQPIGDKVERKKGTGAFGNYEMKREDKDELHMDSGKRIDTMDMNDDNDSYGSGSAHNRYDLKDDDKLSVELDDVVDDDDVIDLNKLKDDKDDEADEQDDEETKDQQNSSNESNKDQSTGSSGEGSNSGQPNLFAVGKSKDKGLADMETGSEVYMSELLVSTLFDFILVKAGFDMEDFDDAEEANEEDLIELGDEFSKVDNLVTFVKDRLNQIIQEEEKGCQYVYYCAKQLPKEDIELAKKFLQFPKEVPPLTA